MNVRLAVYTAYHVLHRYARQNPHKVMKVPFTDNEGDYRVLQVSVDEAAEGLNSLIEHVYPQSESERYKLITRCKECEYYKTLRSKKNPRLTKKYCKKHGIEPKPDFYCASALEKDWR